MQEYETCVCTVFGVIQSESHVCTKCGMQNNTSIHARMCSTYEWLFCTQESKTLTASYTSFTLHFIFSIYFSYFYILHCNCRWMESIAIAIFIQIALKRHALRTRICKQSHSHEHICGRRYLGQFYTKPRTTTVFGKSVVVKWLDHSYSNDTTKCTIELKMWGIAHQIWRHAAIPFGIICKFPGMAFLWP